MWDVQYFLAKMQFFFFKPVKSIACLTWDDLTQDLLFYFWNLIEFLIYSFHLHGVLSLVLFDAVIWSIAFTLQIKVSFRDSGSENFITLKAGNGKCNLHFRDLIERSTDKEPEYVSQFNYFTLSSFGMIFLVALLLCASVWTFITYRKKHLAKTGGKYQRLDMELPVSNGAKMEADANDGWDNSWDDNWDDDEEAPKTPVMPITPSLSSKGIAPRRSNKEGWKD